MILGLLFVHLAFAQCEEPISNKEFQEELHSLSMGFVSRNMELLDATAQNSNHSHPAINNCYCQVNDGGGTISCNASECVTELGASCSPIDRDQGGLVDEPYCSFSPQPTIITGTEYYGRGEVNLDLMRIDFGINQQLPEELIDPNDFQYLPIKASLDNIALFLGEMSQEQIETYFSNNDYTAPDANVLTEILRGWWPLGEDTPPSVLNSLNDDENLWTCSVPGASCQFQTR